MAKPDTAHDQAMSTTTHNIPTGLSLRANFSWTFAGNVVYAACQWGMLTVLAKLGSPEMVGQFALGLAVTAPILMLTNLQLRQIQATDARNEYQFGDYLSLRIITTLLALLIIAGITVVSGYRWETALVILAIGVAKAIESMSDVYYGLLQQHEQMDRIAISMMIKGVLSLIALGIGVYLTGSVFWGAVGLVLAWTVIFAGYDLHSGTLLLPTSRTLPRWEWPTLARLTWLALPLGIVMMLISLTTNLPRYFVERYLGEHELGIFAAMSYIIVAGTTVVGALGQSASPRLARYYATGNRAAFRSLLLKLIGIGALLGGAGVLVALLAGCEVLTLLYGAEYARQDVFVGVMVAGGLWYVASFFGYAATASRRIRYQPMALCIVIGISIVLCYCFVPLYGLWGASVALVGTSIVSMLCYMLLVVRVFVSELGKTNDRTA